MFEPQHGSSSEEIDTLIPWMARSVGGLPTPV